MKFTLPESELRKLAALDYEFEALRRVVLKHQKDVDKYFSDAMLDKGSKSDEELSCAVVDNKSHVGVL